jgi:hypothetical protein
MIRMNNVTPITNISKTQMIAMSRRIVIKKCLRK